MKFVSLGLDLTLICLLMDNGKLLLFEVRLKILKYD